MTASLDKGTKEISTFATRRDPLGTGTKEEEATKRDEVDKGIKGVG